MHVYLLYEIRVVYGGPGEREASTLIGFTWNETDAQEWVNQNTTSDYLGGRSFMGPVDEVYL